MMTRPKNKRSPVGVDTPTHPLAVRAQQFFEELQTRMCSVLEALDGRGKFTNDAWQHPGGGGGLTCVFENGDVFEKAGVNTSAVEGQLSKSIAERMGVVPSPFFATGISLVLHPRNPMVPTVHANFRYFSREGKDEWFGGGADLTPYYLFEEDVVHFHSTLKHACDRHDPTFYPKFKRWCDEYFTIRHRGETRGVGGIFFDYLRDDPEEVFKFVKSVAGSFLDAYIPIVMKRKDLPWGEREHAWQLLRRGRYVEFNLVYDRGTAFGLETGGRVESILMSLPPVAEWHYQSEPLPGSREAALSEVLKHPREWVREVHE